MSNIERELKVFVSYSRADYMVADEIAAGLELAAFEVTIDRHSIIEGEDWKARLGALIADSDTVVFLLSPESATSPVCAWEVDEAVRLSKRLMPVLIRRLGDIPAPKSLASINYVRFDPQDDGTPRPIMMATKALANALRMNVSWLREHTRLLARALEWEGSDRSQSRLLIGSDVEQALLWLNTRPKDAPEPTELHRAFIKASEVAAEERRSEERKRLDEVARTQALHAKELASREIQVKQYSRRSTIFLGGSVVAATVAALAANQAFRWNREYLEVQARRFRDAERSDIAGQLIAYATSPGKVAYDGDGDNSPYCNSILRALAQPDLSIAQAVLDAQHSMSREAKYRQIPFFSSSLNGELFLHKRPQDRKALALAVGNCKYQTLPRLKNPSNDAAAFVGLLQPHVNGVTTLIDCGNSDFKSGFDGAIKLAQEQAFVRVAGIDLVPDTSAKNPTLFIMYFGGTGVMIDRDVYLALIDSRMPDFDRLRNGTPAIEMGLAGWVRLAEITERLSEQFAATVIILDVCLEDPRTYGR